MYVNSKKYKFFKIEMKYFEFLINEKNLHMNSFCIKTVFKWHSHLFRIYYNIQVFIKFCNFYQHFIYNFTDIIWLLHLLLCDMKKDKKLSLIADEWQIFQQEIFKWLIDAFISASVLCHYDLQHKLCMKINVSKIIYANILFQQWKNE